MGEEAPEVADLYFAYGKALLENAISQAGVLGKQDDAETETSGGGKGEHFDVLLVINDHHASN